MLAKKTRISSTTPEAIRRHAKPRKQPAQERSRDTVAVILEAAARVLERRGLEGYNTNAVALAAGVSIGSIYQYFPNKDAMTVALVQHFEAEITAEVGAALQAADDTVEEILRSVVRQMYRVHHRRPVLHRLLEAEEERLQAAIPAPGKSLEEIALQRLRPHRKGSPARLREELADIVTVTRAMIDATLREGTTAQAAERRTMRALRGYLQDQA